MPDIVLVEAQDRVLPLYPADRSASARRQLERLGVEVRTLIRVVGVDDRSVRVVVDGIEDSIAARTVLWAAGVQASSFARAVAVAAGATTDRAGRIVVDSDLAIPGHPEIFAIGDDAVQPWKDGHPVPGVAQGAIQPGQYVGKSIRRRLAGRPVQAFRYRDKGDVAVIGRLAGVTNIGWLGPFGRQGGFTAWLMWLVIHIFYLIGFANRIVVVVRWAWSFFTSGRGTRLITGSPLLPPIEQPAPPAWEPPAEHAAEMVGDVSGDTSPTDPSPTASPPGETPPGDPPPGKTPARRRSGRQRRPTATS